ncbi:MAG: prephenate dehydrogenase [Chloroflexi bacterium]|nr:prephenate dehydrogenase [Chloroflexota bacterium]
MAMSLRDARVAIVGMGLMGGSLAAALKASQACREVIGIARRANSISMALTFGFIDRGFLDLAEGVADADLVVLCTPVRDILAKINTIGPLLKPGCVLLDIGSTKKAICEAMTSMPVHVEPVGGHPMCGKESSGLNVAEAGLYRGRVFVLIPLERTSPQAQALASELVTAIGARELRLDPEHHDRVVAVISHLPYMLAVTLVNAAFGLAGEDPTPWRLAANGFRDTSRVAAGDLAMMMDIVSTNREPILAGVRGALRELGEIEQLLISGDDDALLTRLRAARQHRREVFP